MFPHRAAFSFDIEDWHHSELHRIGEARAEESIVVRGTEAILDVLTRHGWRNTCFVLGDDVRDRPSLIRRRVEEGHELACHVMSHRPVRNATPDTFRAELREFRATVEAVLGIRFERRAPAQSRLRSSDARASWTTSGTWCAFTHARAR